MEHNGTLLLVMLLQQWDIPAAALGEYRIESKRACVPVQEEATSDVDGFQ